MKISLTLNELKHLAFKELNLDHTYRSDTDLLISLHTIEVVDVESELEKSSG